MKRSTQNLIDEYKGKLSGYVALLSYRLANLCIKADPISLLGVTVDVDGLTMNIEDMALVGVGDDEYSIKVYPKDEKYILMIGKGIAEEHSEFKQEMETLKTDKGEELRYIKLTMPEVNKERKEMMEKMVKTLHDDCKTKIDLNKTAYGVRIKAELLGLDKDEAEKISKEVDQMTETHEKTCEDITEEKKKEIDEAYKSYQEKQAQRDKEKQDKAAAEGKDVTSQLKMN